MTNEELALKIQNGEKEYLTELWVNNVKFFHACAQKSYIKHLELCQSSGVTYDDIYQVCFFALVNAVQAFEPDKELKLLTYMSFQLQMQIYELLGIRTTKLRALNQAELASLDDHLTDDSETTFISSVPDPDSEEAFSRIENADSQAELRNALDSAISKLSSERAQIMRDRYFHDKSRRKIAKNLNLKIEELRHAEKAAFRILRRDLTLNKYRDELLSTRAYRATGLTTFKISHQSSVERTVVRLEQLTRQIKQTEG